MKRKNDYGQIIRLNRENQNLSLSVLAQDAKISSSQLSKIEHGTIESKEKTYKKIFEALCIDYHLANNEIIKLDILLDEICKDIIYLYDEEMIKQKWIDYQSSAKVEVISSSSLLIQLILDRTYYFNNDNCKRIVNLLKKIEHQLNQHIKQIFYLYYGLYLHDCNHLVEACFYLEEATKISSSSVIYPMTHYFLGQFYRKRKKTLQSNESLLIAKRAFFKYGNIKRSLLTDTAIANNYVENAEYDEALFIYSECIQIFSNANINIYSKATVYTSILWVLILQKKYEEAYNFMNSIPNGLIDFLQNSRHKAFILCQIIIYNALNKKNMMFALCRQYKHICKSDDFIDNFIMYFNYIDGRKATRMKYLQRNKQLVLQRKDYTFCHFLLDLLRKESTTDKEKDELLDFYAIYCNHQI